MRNVIDILVTVLILMGLGMIILISIPFMLVGKYLYRKNKECIYFH